MVSNRQHAIELGIKAISEKSFDAVGEISFFGDPITAAEIEGGIRRECANLIALIDETDEQYDAKTR